jgi:hypothetical protein
MLTLLLSLCLQDEANTWVKRTPVEGTPVSPRLGYEGDVVWHAKSGLLLRYGGHNQGGGGEQGSEVWTCDPKDWRWTWRQPDLSPPGVCCAQQNVYDPGRARYLRFPAASGGHGWQWRRELDLNGSSVWSYDLEQNRWRDLRPLPAPGVHMLRCASWDSHHEVVVVFGGEGSREGTLVYDPRSNEWTRMKPAREPEGRSGGNLTYDAERRIHVQFGAQFTDDPRTWTYDLRKNEWRELSTATSPPTDKNDAVLAYDARRKLIVAIIRVAMGKGEDAPHRLETWTLDAGKPEWRKMDPAREPDLSGSRARVLAYAAELDAVLLENCPSKPREQQIWTYRAGPPAEAPKAPSVRNLKASLEPGAVTLTWDGPEAKIRRASARSPWTAIYADVAVARSPYRDENLKPDAPLYYEVGDARIRVQPALAEDVVVSVLAADRVEVAWPAVPGAVSYVVERAPVQLLSEDQVRGAKSKTAPLDPPSAASIGRIGAFVRAGESKGAGWEDRGIDLSKPAEVAGSVYTRTLHKDYFDPEGKPYARSAFAYRVRAVDALGIEGGPSASVLTIPSAPRGLLCKEDKGTARLKWSASPEKGLKGYRVYRLDGRWDKDPLSRLTPEPIEALEAADAAAGKGTRRYCVVAVDALGQEGHPSSPVWYEREWKPYYVPFGGEWHP